MSKSKKVRVYALVERVEPKSDTSPFFWLQFLSKVPRGGEVIKGENPDIKEPGTSWKVCAVFTDSRLVALIDALRALDRVEDMGMAITSAFTDLLVGLMDGKRKF